MSEDIDSILNSLFRNGKLNLNSSKSDKSDLEKSLEEMEKMNRRLSESLQSSIHSLSQEVKEEAAKDSVSSENISPELIFPEDNEKVHIAQSSKPVDHSTIVEKLYHDFDEVESMIKDLVIGQEDFVTALMLCFKRPYVIGIKDESLSAAAVLMGKNGTGKHLALEEMTKELGLRGVLTHAQVYYMDLSKYKNADSEKVFVQDLFSAAKAEAQVLAFENFEKAHSNILNLLSGLFIEGKVALTSRYAQQKGMLVDIGTALVPGAVSSISFAGKYLFLITDKNESKILDALGSPFLKACSDICFTAPFTEENIRAIARKELEKLCAEAQKRLAYRLTFDDQTVAILASKFIPDEGVESLQAYIQLLHRALAEFKLHEKGEHKDGKIQANEQELEIQFPQETVDLIRYKVDVDREQAIQDVKKELDGIIGLERVKKYILSLEDNFLIQQIRREKGLKADIPSMHMIFTGNPGTGKTTVARLVSRYLKAIGLLSGGQLIEVTRADLVGKYVGHTAPLTQKAISSALGGVLFIDEAYSLFRGTDDSFGLEAIDTLVKGMEDNRENLVVILAGYTVEMEEFLTANSGLKSRFPNIIEFEDYTADELVEITKVMIKSKGYVLEQGCEGSLRNYFDKMQKTGNASTNGNARMARNKLEEAILNCSRRNILMPAEERNLELLKLEDFNFNEPQ